MGATIAALGVSCSDDGDGAGDGNQALDSGSGGSAGTSTGGSGGTSTGGSSGATTGGSGGVGGPQDEGGLVDAYGTPDVNVGGSAGGPIDEGGAVDAYGTPDF